MSSEDLLALIDSWVRLGWLRPLDRAFMRFLDELAPASEPLLLLAAALTSHQLGRGHVCLDLEATLAMPDEALSLPPEGDRTQPLPPLPSEILHGQTLGRWQQALCASPLVSAGTGDTPLVLSGGRLYLRRYWRYEQQVAQAIAQRLALPHALPEGLRGRLDELFPRLADAPPGQDWQKIACALAVRGAFSVITGGPGTGKTTTVAKLLALLQSEARQHGKVLRIRLAAPTGKAAARLTESIGQALDRLPEAMREAVPTEAGTLHRLLGSRPATRHFKYHADNLLHADVVVVDEASMIDLEMMAALLAALRPGTRLVLLGDKDQLASVESGAVLGDVCRGAEGKAYTPETVGWIAQASGEEVAAFQGDGSRLQQHIAMLRVSHRFKGDSGIGELARRVNAGQSDEVDGIWKHHPPYPDIALITLRDRDDGRLLQFALEGERGGQGYRHYLETIAARRPPPEATPLEYEQWGRLVLTAFAEFQLLCALRRGPWGVEGLNRRIAESLRHAGLIEHAHGWYEGRPVLVTRNDYSLGLMNGDIGIALRFPGTNFGESALRVVFALPDGSIKSVLPSRLASVETVYAMTVHKSQGSEFTHAALVLPDTPNPILTRELAYTGITRAKRCFTLLAANPAMLAYAVANRVKRSGGLCHLL